MPSFSGVVRNAMTCGSAEADATLSDAQLAARLMQRQNLLHPPGRQARGLDAEVLQLPAHRGADADALLRRLLGRHTVEQAWNDATKMHRPDKLRALLMLVDEHNIKQQLATPLFNSPMHQALNKPGLTDAGLSAVIKEYPYYSSKPTDEGRARPPKNLNGKGVFSEMSRDSARQIVCRHLAIHQTEKMNESELAKFKYREEFYNVELIQDKVQPDSEERYVLRLLLAPEVHLVSNAKFGEFLSGQFTAMAGAGEKKKMMILNSHNHTMSLGLRIKNKNGHISYVTKFYDPNQTTAHARSATQYLNTIETRSIDDYLSSKSHVRTYFPRGSGSIAVFVGPPAGMTNEAAFENAGSLERKLASSNADIDVFALHLLGQWGFGVDLRSMVPEFNALLDRQKVALLSTEIDGQALLETAMKSTRGKLTGAYAELLNTIPSNKRAALVGKRNQEGMNAAGLALKELREEKHQLEDLRSVLALVPLDQRAAVIDTAKVTAQPFPRQLARFAIPLLKRHGFEESGLVAAVKAGDCEAIRAYGELIKMVPLKRRAALVFKEHKEAIYRLGRHSPNEDAGKTYKTITDLDKLENNIVRPH